jgi:iron complex transport system substrate-binding protein
MDGFATRMMWPLGRLLVVVFAVAWLGLSRPANAAAASPAAATSAAVTVSDARGRLIKLVAPPQRIVSLMPSLTESVCALGACERLVGVDRYSNWPDAVRRLPKLGGLEDAQIEAIVALRPDVVLAARSSRAIGRLEALGLKVLALEPVDHAELRTSLATLATLLGRPGQAEALWQQIDDQVRRATAQVPPAWRGQRVYFEVDAAPYAAGAVSFVGQTLTQLGLAHIIGPELGPFPKLNPEFVLRAQPDLVMAVTHDLASMPQRPGWSHLRALQRRRVCAFAPADYDMLVRPGPRLGEGALLIAACLSQLGAPSPAASGAAR